MRKTWKLKSKTKIRKSKPKKGMVLFIVLAFTCILTITALTTLNITSGEIILTQRSVKKAKAFYLAEAALAKFSANTQSDVFDDIEDSPLGEGTYYVDYYPDEDPPYAIATGSVKGEEKSIKVELSFLAPPYECGAYAGNVAGIDWDFILGGTGEPTYTWLGNYGGRDILNGNIFAGGDVHLYGESSVNPPLAPNPFGLNGDVEATGTINVHDSASISGSETEGVAPYSNPDLVGMNYAVNHTHNVSQIFTDEGVSSGHLPVGHELRDVFVKNPSDRPEECATTAGDDFFFEPSDGFQLGGPFEGGTPLDAGEDRIYYIDGDLWVASDPTFGFTMEGKATIVVTGDIHICDNLEYADDESILGMVALGEYDEDGDLISGGNVYFGDPLWGNMGMFSAMMFAANDFLYNTDPITSSSAEPESGFTLNGSLIALNQVSIERDWYTESTYTDRWGHTVEERRPCYYNPQNNHWMDTISGGALTPTQEATITHYQMIINYDDRVRSQATQPTGLPRGEGTIFEGLRNWEEVFAAGGDHDRGHGNEDDGDDEDNPGQGQGQGPG